MMRYLLRNKVYEKKTVLKDAKKVYIFCEGTVTEVKYFTYFTGFSSNIDIIPIPCVDGQSDPVKLKENAESLFFGGHPKFCLSEEYNDEVWFVIDTDRWNEGDKIQQLKNFCVSKNAKKVRWFIAQSNPAFELWLYYHLHEKKPIGAEVMRYSTFKEYVNSNIPGGFDCRRMPVELKSAINNSLGNYRVKEGQPDLYSTEMHALGQIILGFVEDQLRKAKEMMST